MMIKATNINKSYGDSRVLKDVCVELESGEVTILFGPSGCGKTTLLRNLSLLDIPDSGQLTLFESQYNFPLKLNQRIENQFPRLTVVFQQLFLWPHLRNRENVMLALNQSDLSYGIKNEYLASLIQAMEMENYIDKFPNESSLGQKQRVAIARALILSPEFIFFDEITASLDVLQVNRVLELILSLKKENMGFLFITHNIDIAKKIGDKLIFMQDGRIVESGTREILTKPQTEELRYFLNLF